MSSIVALSYIEPFGAFFFKFLFPCPFVELDNSVLFPVCNVCKCHLTWILRRIEH